MPRVKLSDSREIFVGISHKTITSSIDGDERRGTVVWVTDGDRTIEATSICRPPDQFSRAQGRKVAATKLLNELRRRNYSRNDRDVVFRTICPQFNS